MKTADPSIIRIQTFVDASMTRPVPLALSRFEGSLFITHHRNRRPNQDAAAVVEHNSGDAVIAIADGAGGHSSGSLAARIAIESVCNHTSKEILTQQTILDAFDEANQTIRARTRGGLTTLLVLVVREKTIQGFHTGDSGFGICGGKGLVKYRSVGHSTFDLAIEAGMEIAKNDEGDMRNTVTNMVGSADMRIEVGPKYELAPQDLVVAGSDGLFDNLDVYDRLKNTSKRTPHHIADHFSQLSLDQMYHHSPQGYAKPDDITIVCLRQKAQIHRLAS